MTDVPTDNPLRAARLRLGMTLREVAERANAAAIRRGWQSRLSISNVSDRERGRQNLGDTHAQLLIDALDLRGVDKEPMTAIELIARVAPAKKGSSHEQPERPEPE